LKTSHHDDVTVVIPAFNEGQKIVDTLNQLQEYFNQIIVVDDGSTDDTASLASNAGVIVLSHPINLGQGAALQTGIELARNLEKTNYILTFDADGQHSIESAISMIEEIKTSNVDIVLGSRFINRNSQTMPKKKKLILKLGILFTRFDSGLQVTDTHNGLRVMNKRFAKSLNLRQSGMAHASEILSHIKESGATWNEFPAEIYYTEYSIKKGQSVFNAINILTEMMHK